jgi:hypothetical protein
VPGVARMRRAMMGMTGACTARMRAVDVAGVDEPGDMWIGFSRAARSVVQRDG